MAEDKNEKAQLVPKVTVFEEARSYGFFPSEDQFDRFRDAHLLDDLLPIRGTNQRGFTPEQRIRFLNLLWICQGLKTERPRIGEVAFWLCWMGYRDVPAQTICEFIDESLQSTLGKLRRTFTRTGVPVGRQPSDPRAWDSVGKPWVRFTLKHPLRWLSGSEVARQVVQSMFALIIRAVLTQASFETVGRLFRKVVFVITGREPDPQALRDAWDGIVDAARVIDIDQTRNPLLKAIREVNATNPVAIVDYVQDGRRFVEQLCKFFPWFTDARAMASGENADLKPLEWANRALRISSAAIVATLRDNEHTSRVREQLRSGNTAESDADLAALKMTINSIVDRIK
jgi:hypothetical protein